MSNPKSSEEIWSAEEALTVGDSRKQKVSSAEAVLLGALAPGVNVNIFSFQFIYLTSPLFLMLNAIKSQAPTWSAVKFTFFTLAVCLAAMLALALSSSDATMIIHLLLLLFISALLFFLLTSFLAETGLVSVEQQMQDMGLTPRDQCTESTKKSS